MSFLRYDKISVAYFDEEGKEHKEELNNFYSRVFQHETDHLNGILIADRCNQYRGSVMSDPELYNDNSNTEHIDKLFDWLDNSYSCKYISVSNIVPFRYKEQYLCNSPTNLHSCSREEVEKFCGTFTRNYNNCKFYK